MVADWTWRFNRITKQTTMTINSKFELQAAQRELSALMTDWQELESEMLKQVGTSYEEMSKQIEVGIKNGASLDMQLYMIKKLFSNTH
jgi:hypothetical protein